MTADGYKMSGRGVGARGAARFVSWNYHIILAGPYIKSFRVRKLQVSLRARFPRLGPLSRELVDVI